MKILNLQYGILLLAFFGLFASCEETETPTYNWNNNVHFEVGRRDDLKETSVYSFAYEEGEVTKMTAVVRIQLEGKVEAFDRKIDLEVVDQEPRYTEYFEFNPDTCYIRAGKSYLDLNITLHRFPDMQDAAHKLVLALKENDYFTTTTKTWVNTSDQKVIDVLRHTVTSSDIVEPPITWYPLDSYEFGVWSAKKFLLMCEVTGFKRKDFQDQSYMGSGRKNYIKDVMKRYFAAYKIEHANDQEALKKIQEEDGSFMTMGS